LLRCLSGEGLVFARERVLIAASISVWKISTVPVRQRIEIIGLANRVSRQEELHGYDHFKRVAGLVVRWFGQRRCPLR